MFFTKKLNFREVELVIRELDEEQFLDLYDALHEVEIEPSYFSVKTGERNKKHLRRVSEVLDQAGIPEELIAKKNIALTCGAISKRRHLDQVQMAI